MTLTAWRTEPLIAQQTDMENGVDGTDDISDLTDSLANQVCRINLNRQCQRGPDSFPFGGRKNSAEGVLSVGDALTAFSLPAMLAAGEGDGKTLLEELLAADACHFVRRS